MKLQVIFYHNCWQLVSKLWRSLVVEAFGNYIQEINFKFNRLECEWWNNKTWWRIYFLVTTVYRPKYYYHASSFFWNNFASLPKKYIRRALHKNPTMGLVFLAKDFFFLMKQSRIFLDFCWWCSFLCLSHIYLCHKRVFAPQALFYFIFCQ